MTLHRLRAKTLSKKVLDVKSVWDGYVVNTNTNKDDTPIKGDLLSLDRRKGI